MKEAMETFTPSQDRVLLRRVDSGSTTKSGFVVPDTAKEKPTECIVVEIGAPYTTEWGTTLVCPVNVGDTVLIGKYSGSSEIKLDGVEHICVRWGEIIGTLKRETIQ